MDWFTAAAFVLGVAAGALTMYLLRRRFNDTQALRGKLSELQAELENYRAQVDEHFERTADLFQEVTQKYRSLHDHLAQGATGLTRGSKRLTSVELPEKSLLPAQPRQQPIDASQTGAPSVASDAVTDEQTLAPRVPASDETAELSGEDAERIAREDVVRR